MKTEKPALKTTILITGITLILLASLYSQNKPIGGGLVMPSFVSTWLIASIFSFGVLGYSLTQKRLFVSKPTIYLGWYLLAIFLIGLINTKQVNFDFFLYELGFIGIFIFSLALSQFRIRLENLSTLFKSIVFVGLVQAFMGLIQYYDSELFIYKNYLSIAALSTLSGTTQGSFFQANMFASFIALSILSAVYLAIETSKSSGNKLEIAVYFFSLIILFWAMSLTGSRAGTLGLTIGLAMLITHFRKQIIQMWPIVLALLLSAFIGIFLSGLMTENFAALDKVASKTLSTYEGTDVRWVIYQAGWEAFLNQPWLGHGIGNAHQAMLATINISEIAKSHPNLEVHKLVHPHNEILYWMIQTGSITLLGVLALAWLFFKQLFKTNRTNSFIILGMMSPLIVMTQVSIPFSQSALHLLLIIVFFHIGFGHEKTKEITWNTDVYKFAFIPVFSLTALLLIYGAWYSLKSNEEVYEYNYYIQQTPQNKMRFLEQKEADYALLKHAKNHPIYEPLTINNMNTFVEGAFIENNKNDVTLFVEWATSKPEYQADSRTMFNLIKSLVALQQVESAKILFEMKQGVFSHDQTFQELGPWLSGMK